MHILIFKNNFHVLLIKKKKKIIDNILDSPEKCNQFKIQIDLFNTLIF